jgi:hypothetical protein
MVRGDRRELIVYTPREPEEIGKLLAKRGRIGENEDEERENRKSVENGVSVEAEYKFSSAIGRYSKIAKEEGRYKGAIVRNIAEQLKMRARFEGKGRARKYVLLIGASEMRRMAAEIGKIGEQVIMQGPMVRIRGEWSADKVYQAVEQAKLCEIDPDRIVIAGPGNSQIKHGRMEIRGFGPEKRIVCKEDGRIMTEFHLTEPSKTTVREKERSVGLVQKMVEDLGREFPESEIVYVGLLPRHVEKCCNDRSHMQEEDVVILHNGRKEFDQMVRERIGKTTEIVEWYELLGMEKEPSIREIREKKVVSSDGVHLEKKWRAAVNLISRIVEDDVVVAVVENGEKRLKTVEKEME